MSRSIGVLKNLPRELEYLIEPALKYGIYQTDDDRFEFLQSAGPETLAELARVAERYRSNSHAELVADFFDDCPITDHEESACLHWLFGILIDAGMNLAQENSDSVEGHIKKLTRFGSFRRASERARAAQALADFGVEARPAVALLRRALQDEDLRVQVWAHFALARIEGDRAAHEQAVLEIYSRHNQLDEMGCHEDDIGGEAFSAIEKFREWQPDISRNS